MKYLSSFVQKPTTPPAPQTATVGTVQVAHRRKNLAGGYSEAVIVANTSLPNTFVYQGYNDTANLDSDEILVKATPGNWYKVPPANLSGLVATIPSPVPVSWETVTDAELADSQAQFTISTLDFGSFNSASEPSQTFFLLNDGTDTILSLDFAVNASDGNTLAAMDSRVRVDYEGVLGSTGVGNFDSAANASLTYSLGGRNSHPITIGPKGVSKITLNLVNFPATGLDSLTIGAEFVFNPNRSGFALPTFLDWENGAIYVTPESPLNPVDADPNSLGVLVSPLSVRVGNLVYESAVEQVLIPSTTSTGSVDCELYSTQTGSLGVSEVGLAPPAGSVVLGSLTYDTSTGAVSDWKPAKAPQNKRYYLEPDSLLTVGRGVQINSSGFLVHGEEAVGVAVSTDGHFVPFGWVQCELGATVTKGQALSPNSVGVFSPSTGGRAIAQESGDLGDLITCFLLNPNNEGGGTVPGSETDISITRTGDIVIVRSSTGSNGAIRAATDTEAGVMTAADRIKLDGVQSGATITDLGFTRTASDLTVTNSGGDDTTLPAATTTQAGLMTAADKVALANAGGGGSSPTNLTSSSDATTVTVESSTGTDATLTAATTSLAGVLSAADKTKLDGIASGATVSNLSFTRNATNLTVVNSGGDDVTLPVAQPSLAGMLSAADKTKLNGVQSGATVSDLTLTRTSTTAAILNSGGTDVVIPIATPSLVGLLSAADKTKLDGLSEGGGGGTSPTDLTISRDSTSVTVVSSTGTDGTIPEATTTNAGVLSAADKTKLNGLQNTVLLGTAAPTVYTITASGGSVTTVDIPAASGSAAGLMLPAEKTKLAGVASGATVSNLSFTRTGVDLTVVNSGGVDVTLPLATTSLAGLLSPTDKTKLDTTPIITGPANVLYINNWSTYVPATNAPTRVYRVGDVVILNGIIKGTNTGTPLFRIPIGYRPPQNVVMTFSTAGLGIMHVYIEASTGDVIQFGASGDQLTYTLINGSWII